MLAGGAKERLAPALGGLWEADGSAGPVLQPLQSLGVKNCDPAAHWVRGRAWGQVMDRFSVLCFCCSSWQKNKGWERGGGKSWDRTKESYIWPESLIQILTCNTELIMYFEVSVRDSHGKRLFEGLPAHWLTALVPLTHSSGFGFLGRGWEVAKHALAYGKVRLDLRAMPWEKGRGVWEGFSYFSWLPRGLG